MPHPDRNAWVSSISKRGFHRIAYVEWGDPASERVAVCVHGLSRQGRDFDVLASAMARQGWRVICPDLPGRGRSGWLRDPQEYNLPQYAMDLATIIARLGVANVDWIGTSLGGLIGMVLAGQKNSPIRKLVVNDVGPFLPWQALHRLGNSVRNAPRTFPDLASATTHHRTVLAPFGQLTDGEWEHLARHSIVEMEGGDWRKRCDPEITAAFRSGLFFNLSLWSYWDAIRCPTLVLRGADSDLLLPSTAKDMTRRGPRADLVEFADCGHAPALMDELQVGTVIGWLGPTTGKC
ncbi:MAG: alpha/beta fold hydrolase [Janthinobacterium lividum]